MEDKLTDKELDLLDQYIVTSMDEAIEDIPWDDIEYRFDYKISSIVDEAIDRYAECVAYSLNEVMLGSIIMIMATPGSIEMCKDEACVMVSAKCIRRNVKQLVYDKQVTSLLHMIMITNARAPQGY